MRPEHLALQVVLRAAHWGNLLQDRATVGFEVECCFERGEPLRQAAEECEQLVA